MESDKIRADDTLISTDVDKLIKIISEKKRLNFVELQRLSGIKNRNDLETWARVLEDEGYIKIEYGITGTYIIWAGGEYCYKTTEEIPVSAEAMPKNEEKIVEEDSIKEEPKIIENELPPAEEKTPEELLEEYVRMKRAKENQPIQKEEGIKKNILEKVTEEEQTVAEEDAPEPILLKEPEPPKPALLIEEENLKVIDNDMRDLIAAYMEEIKEERARLEQLKRKKEMFYKEELSALQKMSEGELLSFIDAVLAHEKKLLELRESVLELPQKVESVVKLKSELRRLGEEGKNAARQTKEKIEQLSIVLKLSERDLQEKMSDLRMIISDNEKKINALESLKDSINSRVEKAELSTEAIKMKIDELNGMLQTMQEYLNETKKTKDDVATALEEMRSATATKQAELESIENEFEELNKLAGWIKEYVNDYDSKIAEIEESVERSEKDIIALKQAAEAAYLKRYLSELQNLSEKYEEKLDHAIKTEKEINSEIEAAKERIAQLIKQSQKLIEKIGSETADVDYESVKKRAESRSKKLRGLVEEKENEKKRLSESIKKKKKGKK